MTPKMNEPQRTFLDQFLTAFSSREWLRSNLGLFGSFSAWCHRIIDRCPNDIDVVFRGSLDVDSSRWSVVRRILNATRDEAIHAIPGRRLTGTLPTSVHLTDLRSKSIELVRLPFLSSHGGVELWFQSSADWVADKVVAIEKAVLGSGVLHGIDILDLCKLNRGMPVSQDAVHQRLEIKRRTFLQPDQAPPTPSRSQLELGLSSLMQGSTSDLYRVSDEEFDNFERLVASHAERRVAVVS
ncbi:MAG: hypothetical protein AAGD32_07645 [Planctomycetota bacterium]